MTRFRWMPQRDDLPWAMAGLFLGLALLALALVWRSSADAPIVVQSAPAAAETLHVYVGGAVTTSGVYDFQPGTTVAQAIQAAGGLRADADPSGINVAANLTDKQEILVPTRNQPVADVQPFTAQQPTFAPQPTAPLAVAAASTLIDINSADATTLQRLPGIGPAISARIIEYRDTNGPFHTIEDLEAVRGISMRMVEEMRALITVGP